MMRPQLASVGSEYRQAKQFALLRPVLVQDGVAAPGQAL
jgi:hypothetical protein